MKQKDKINWGTDNQGVIDALYRAYVNRTRVRLFYGHDNGKSWHKENDVEGYVGMTTGLPTPILVYNERSYGGGEILTDCIVKIVAAASPHTTYYTHPQFDGGEWYVESAPADLQALGYTTSVYVDGSNVANFRSDAAAIRYVKKMNKGGGNITIKGVE